MNKEKKKGKTITFPLLTALYFLLITTGCFSEHLISSGKRNSLIFNILKSEMCSLSAVGRTAKNTARERYEASSKKKDIAISLTCLMNSEQYLSVSCKMVL